MHKLENEERKSLFTRNESEYWDIVDGRINPDPNSEDNEFIVEYASDLPVDKYGIFDKDPLLDDSEGSNFS